MRKKVLPGIEFSVEFVEGKVIHIVTIFDDRDDEKVRNIQKIMEQGKGMSCYKKLRGHIRNQIILIYYPK